MGPAPLTKEQKEMIERLGLFSAAVALGLIVVVASRDQYYLSHFPRVAAPAKGYVNSLIVEGTEIYVGNGGLTFYRLIDVVFGAVVIGMLVTIARSMPQVRRLLNLDRPR